MRKLSASKLGLYTKLLPSSILGVIDKLSEAGYQAYIVGGSVRDLILGLNPKDFDAVTNATPAQIKQVFGKRCRIIGKRFELAHVMSGSEVIEVATFRKTPEKSHTSNQGMILRDNHWGTIDDDFVRRDFSVNALYYQPREGVVLDFCRAIEDIQQRKLRLLGNPRLRFEEDPVRMLRTIRFAAKLNFEIDGEVLAALNAESTQLLRQVSPHRMYDEVHKLVTSGHLSRILPMLIHYQLWQYIFPDVPAKITPLMKQSAQNTDVRVQQSRGVAPAFFYAVMLWKQFNQRCEQLIGSGKSPANAHLQAGADILKRQSVCTAIPRFVEWAVRETWEMQFRLIRPKPAKIMFLVGHERFRAGLDFLQLREKVKEIDSQGMVAWWDSFYHKGNDDKQQAILEYQRQLARTRHQQKDETNKVASKKSKTKLPKIEELSQDTAESDVVLDTLLSNREAKTAKEGYSRTIQYDETSEKLAIVRRKRVQRDIEPILEKQQQVLNRVQKGS